MLHSTLQAQSLNRENLAYNFSYFGETAIHPGIKVGVEYAFYEKTTTKKRWFKKRQERLGPKIKKHQFVWTGNLAFYNHPNNHSGLLLNGEIGWKRTKMRKGSTFATYLGAGYLHRFYNIDTYQLGTNGEPDKITAAGQSAFVASFAVGFGRDLSVRRNLPIAYHIKPTVLFQTPYNHSGVLNAALEVGVTYKISQ